jgi:putative Holliday junction resolvase
MSENNTLAIDFGRKRFGFAVGNRETRVALPLPPVDRKNNRQMLSTLRKLVGDYEVGRIIIGYPLNMDGTKSDTCAEVDAFVRFLEPKIGLPIVRVEERLTSFEAEELLKTVQSDFRKRKRILDSVSAQLILYNYWAAK